jgi:hypothetical protein
MASPDDPDATADAGAAPVEHRPLSDERVGLPIYRPRRRTTALFWFAFAIAALVCAVVLWLVLT